MTFHYVLKDGLRAQAKLNWYLSRGWEIVGKIHLGGWKSLIMRKCND